MIRTPFTIMRNANRFSEFRQFVHRDGGLTREEARYLRFLLYDLRTDLIGESPLEIVIMIALHLPLNELTRCLRVSKVWRQQFLAGPVMAAYARANWPAMIDGEVNQQDFLATLSRFGWVCYYTLPFIDEVASEVVPWFSPTHYQLDPAFHARADELSSDYTQAWERQQQGEAETSALYFSGKLAWCLNNRLIIIDDFRSKTRKIFTVPSGVRHGLALKLQAFGSRLAIAVVDRLVIAWDHIDNRSYEKSLPTRVLRCATQNNRVAFVMHGGDVMIWTPGQAVLQLDPSLPSILKVGNGSSEAHPPRTLLYPFFDAHNSETLYLASACFFLDNSKPMIRITVHEFLTSGHVASWSSEYEDPNSGDRSYLYWTNPDPEPRILMTDYELDRSCILFFRGTPRHGAGRFAAFDKLERKFIDIDYMDFTDRWTLVGNDWSTSGGALPEQTVEGRIDLDFSVMTELQGYRVIRLQEQRYRRRP
ncbi:hypothetical protein GGR51DRAFT_501217 [Nemania sp. FL0031]|nr:hypothetical protein GGR51DRAFT_501217 [Nemania sp. FL0031]